MDAESIRRAIMTCNVIGCPNQLDTGEVMICTACRKANGWEAPIGIVQYVLHWAAQARKEREERGAPTPNYTELWSSLKDERRREAKE